MSAPTPSGAPTGGPRLVGLRHPPDDRFLARLRGLWADGDAVLPLPADLGQAQRLVTALRPDAVVDDLDGRVQAEAPGGRGGPSTPERLPVGTALVVATSGSTGGPRGVVLSHDAVRAAVDTGNQRLGVGATDRWLACLPLHHVAGLLVLLRGGTCRTATIVHPGFDVGAVRAALAAPTPPTVVSLVPTMLHRLLAAAVPVGGLRVLLGGAAADPGLLSRAQAAGATVVTSYGMTETCGGVVYDGRPLDGAAVALTPSGTILLRGPTLASGLLDRAWPQLQRGWLVTADHGRWADDGRLEVLGRLDDVVVTGGENVSTAAVARALRRVPGVRDAAVVGLDDSEWGQRLEAWIVPAVRTLSPADVIAAVRADLSPPEVPKRLHVVDDLPRTALGKVARAALTDLPTRARWP